MKRTQNAIYLPPALPEYLKNIYDLKPIVGSPNDDEVKGIQAVIRAAQNAAQIPGMLNPELSMSLAQHIFEVQMARYREKYPCGMFPEDMIHTPPALPSHVTFTLEPVVGAPSDEELQAAQAAMRGYEQMAIFPMMFDPSISMELSQHLFNLQLARYMHNAPRAELGKNMNKSPSAPPSKTQQPSDVASEISDKEAPEISSEPNTRGPPTAHLATPPPQTELTACMASLQAKVDESNDRLTKIADTLDGVKKSLTRTQQNSAQTTSPPSSTSWSRLSSRLSLSNHYETRNDEGQFPSSQGLPLIMRGEHNLGAISPLSNESLVRYLQFYNIGGDLISPGDIPSIRDGKRNDAEKCLSNYINDRARSS